MRSHKNKCQKWHRKRAASGSDSPPPASRPRMSSESANGQQSQCDVCGLECGSGEKLQLHKGTSVCGSFASEGQPNDGGEGIFKPRVAIEDTSGVGVGPINLISELTNLIKAAGSPEKSPDILKFSPNNAPVNKPASSEPTIDLTDDNPPNYVPTGVHSDWMQNGHGQIQRALASTRGDKKYCNYCTRQLDANGDHECPLKCDICGKQCKGSAGYRNHREGHLKNQVKQCPICGITTTTSMAYANHVRLSHPTFTEQLGIATAQYKCMYCAKMFVQKTNLSHHVARVHRVNPHDGSVLA